jgi:hypothetical protein
VNQKGTLVEEKIDAALARPDWQSAQTLTDLEALSDEVVPLLRSRLEGVAAQLASSSPSSKDERRLQLMMVALGLRFARQSEPFPESLIPMVRWALGSWLQHLRVPDRVIAALKSVPAASLEALLVESPQPLSFWEVVPACPTKAVVARGVEIVLGWQKGKLSSSELPKRAVGAFIASGDVVASGLAAGIMAMEKQPYRGVLVEALASLPPTGADALVEALSDSSSEVVGHARRGLLGRAAQALPAIDAMIAKTKKAALLTILRDLRAEIGPVEVGSGKTGARTPSWHRSKSSTGRRVACTARPRQSSAGSPRISNRRCGPNIGSPRTTS